MPDSDLLPPLLFKINENQLALEAAMELSNWVELRASREVADNVRGTLDTGKHYDVLVWRVERANSINAFRGAGVCRRPG